MMMSTNVTMYILYVFDLQSTKNIYKEKNIDSYIFLNILNLFNINVKITQVHKTNSSNMLITSFTLR